jgi:hypothetical protein
MMMLMLTRTEELFEEMSMLQVPPSQMRGLMILFKALAFFCFLFSGTSLVLPQFGNNFKTLSGWTFYFWLCRLIWFWNDIPCLGPLVVLVAVHQSVTTPPFPFLFLINE